MPQDVVPMLHRQAATSTTATALPVRIMHWINVVALTILLMSGLQIFNAHPALVLGQVVVRRHAAGARDRRAAGRQRRRSPA